MDEKEIKEVPKKEKKTIIVTSNKTIDFPSIGWGIHAGEERELPEDEETKSVILSSHFISLKK